MSFTRPFHLCSIGSVRQAGGESVKDAVEQFDALEIPRSRWQARMRSRSSVGSGRSSYEETDFHQLEEDRWAKSTAEEVNKRALSNDFDALAIVAPPRTLGELRKKLHKEAERRVVCEIPKEMTGHTIADIEKLIVNHTKAEQPADV